MNPFSEDFILHGVLSFLSELLSYINPFSENFFVYKLIDLLGDLLKLLFFPSDNFFNDKVEDMKNKISQKIPYQDYINMFETIQQVESGENISIDLKGYKIGNSTFNINNFIDFGWITEYKETWYSWVRGVIFILLIIYNINQIMKLFRGYNVAEGISKIENGFSNNAWSISGQTSLFGGNKK